METVSLEKIIMIRLLCVFLICFPAAASAQFNYKLFSDIPVQQADVQLATPWVGGLNAVQFNSMDINGDGLDDLVLYDRMSSLVIPYLQVEGKYQHAPDYAPYFASVTIENYLILRDYNCDGRMDLFTGNVLGIKVYTNLADAGEVPVWKPFIFYTPTGGKSAVLLSKGTTTKSNVALQPDDFPALVDADGDGDLDLFNVIYPTGTTIEYHRNFSMERYGVCDSLDFERQTRRWGGVSECVCGTFAFNDAPCPANGRTQHAGGKSLTAMDVDGNGVMDLLLSEAECNRIFLLRNEGDLENPVVTTASVFPTGTTGINIFPYPSAYYEDVDFDGVKDLLASPNIFSRTYLNTDLENSVWYYKNTGTTAAPVFSFMQRDFLQDSMIDVGDNAVPVLADLDSDGDADLLVSRYTSANLVSSVYAYENTGDNLSPVFTLVNEDFLNFSTYPFYNVKIHLADMNNDGRTDFVFTATNISNGVTSLYYIPNATTTGYDWSLADVQLVTLPEPISFSENIYPTDIDRDGKTDILHGRTNGAVYFWRNAGALNFVLGSDAYLGMNSSVLRQSVSFTTADLNADGKTELVVGDQQGKLLIINDFHAATSHTEGTTNIIWNVLSETYETRNLGGRVWPTVGNLFNAQQPVILVGNTMGGMFILRPQEEGVLPEEPVISLYPNPVIRPAVLFVKADRAMQMEIFSAVGKILQAPITIQAFQPYTLNTGNLAAGLYLLRFTLNNQSYVKRFVVE